jgi:4-amino-4-deoxy-L-arabinose transferase-like glycosyltransferase
LLLSILFGSFLTLAMAYALGVLLLRKTPAPPEIALALGAAAESFLVFILLLLNAAQWWVFLAVAAAVLFASQKGDRRIFPAGKMRLSPFWAVFLAYGVWYFVNALAPETVADGITYHLGLPYEYVRLGGFPDRIAFYDLVPQGMEMLYTVAFAFGRHSAAKLVEFGFFLATLPLIFRIGRRLGMSDLASLVAAVFYFCAPVVGLTGSCTYNDAALVFFTLAAFYLLLAWRDTSEGRYLLPAGMLAGFCYAIKFPGIFTVAAAVLFALARRRVKAAVLVAAGAVLVMAPWMARNAALTGNPVAPLMNGLFPNPYFHLATEKELTAGLSSLGPVTPAHVPWELAFGDHLTGTFGPLLFALPLGLVALRRREGRLCWAAAALVALPWFSNTGARFLMPSVAFAALALGMSLPRRAAWAAIAIQAVLCWPRVIDTWETRYAFRLHEFPWRAALRIEPEPEYLKKRFDEYNVAKLIERATPPEARTLALLTVANAYLDRDVTVTWQSAEGDQMLDTLRLAALYTGDSLFDWKASWPIQPLRAVRFRLPVSHPGEWDISEAQLYSGEDRVFSSPQWTLNAWPNPWEAPLAFDVNLATRWRTWEPMRAGMFLEADFDHPQRLTSAVLLSHTPVHGVPLEFHGQGTDGKWRLLSNAPEAIRRPPEDLRLEATRALRRAGFRYLLAPTGGGGNAPIGNNLAAHAPEWGLERAGEAGRYLLFRVK